MALTNKEWNWKEISEKYKNGERIFKRTYFYIGETRFMVFTQATKLRIEKNLQNKFPLHHLCRSEDPTFNQNTIIPTKEECCRQDDFGWTPLMYLMHKHTAKYDTIEQLVQIGGKESLTIKDKRGRNVMHWALKYYFHLGHTAVINLLLKKDGENMVDTLLDSYPAKFSERFFKQNDFGITPLMYLLANNTAERYAIEQLMKVGGKDLLNLYNIGWNMMNCAMEYYFHSGDASVIWLLLRKGGNNMIGTILEFKPTFRDVAEIMNAKGIPQKHRLRLQQYSDAILENEVDSFIAKQVKVPLMRSTITVLGRGRDGKTSTINALKGLSFQTYYESTKGAEISEVDVHDIGIHITSVEASGSIGAAFEEAQRDSHSTKRSVAQQLMGTDDKEDAKRIANNRNSIRFTIYDNGGQRVFRSIQSLLLSRDGIFIVVFNMMRILDKSTRKESLEHLEYWLSTIKLGACKEDFDDTTSSSAKYPPVILVGTHYDEFISLYQDDPKLRNSQIKVMNNVLLQKLKKPLQDFAPISNKFEDSIEMETLDLCFWPIDNSNSQDTNIHKIRQVLHDTTINDPGFDVTEKVPISMLNAMDKLTEISQLQPIIPIESGSEKEETSVMQVMADCGIFDNVSFDKNKELELCKALLKKYHNIGHFLYFHQESILQDYCILDPQWLINVMTYVVRDFPYHWFPRDKRAIELNNGVSWKRLKDDCILDMPLLRQLWLGYDEHFEFLKDLMIEIGMFGECNGIFTVPILRASENCDESWRDKFSNHNEIGSIELGKHGFAIVPFYCRLVNSLVALKDACEPIIMPSVCFFRFKSERDTFALWLNHTERKVSIYSNWHEYRGDQVFAIIKEKCKHLSKVFYKKQLDFRLNEVNKHVARKLDLEVLFSSKLSFSPPAFEIAKEIFRDKSTTNQDQNKKCTEYEKRVFGDLVTLLKLKFVSAETAKKVAKTMVDADAEMTMYSLRNLFHLEGEETFKNETLEDLGVTNKFDRKRVIQAIKEKFPEPIAPKKIMVACMETNTNANDTTEPNFEREENMIKYMLAQSNFEAIVLQSTGGFFSKNLFDSSTSKFKFLHIGAHKQKVEEDTAFKGMLKNDDCKKQFECLLFNICKSKEMIDIAETEFKNKFIIYWDSRVTDEAAIRFAEQFYYYYCAEGTRENPISFEEAARKAKKSMIDHNFVFEDPDENANKNDGKLYAGVLKFPSGNTEEAPVTINDENEANEASHGMNPTCVSPNIDSVGRSTKKAKTDSSIIDNTSSSVIEKTSTSKKRSRDGDVVAAVTAQESSDDGSQKDENDQKQSASQNNHICTGEKSTCNLHCIYKFACGHELEANCQFIKYMNTKNPSLANIDDIFSRNPARPKTYCAKCQKHFCTGLLKIPKNEQGTEFETCFSAHRCQDGYHKPVVINIDRLCREFSLKPKKNKSGATQYAPCNSEDCRKAHEKLQEEEKKEIGLAELDVVFLDEIMREEGEQVHQETLPGLGENGESIDLPFTDK